MIAWAQEGIIIDTKQGLYADRYHDNMPIGTALAVVAQLIPKQAGRILDIGCNNGTLGWMLKARRNVSVTGIELTPQAAEQAASVLDAVVRVDVEAAELPFAPESFDCIVMADVIEHLVDPEKVIPKLVRLLAPGGSLVMSVPNVRFHGVLSNLLFNGWWGDRGVVDYPHLRFFTLRTLVDLLGRNGLAIRDPLIGVGVNLPQEAQPFLELLLKNGENPQAAKFELESLQLVFRAQVGQPSADLRLQFIANRLLKPEDVLPTI